MGRHFRTRCGWPPARDRCPQLEKGGLPIHGQKGSPTPSTGVFGVDASMFQACPKFEPVFGADQGETVSQLAWEHLGLPSNDLVDLAQERAVLAKDAAPAAQTGISGSRWGVHVYPHNRVS